MKRKFKWAKEKMRMEKRNYANYFGKYITQYTPCRWGWEHKTKRWQRERENENERMRNFNLSIFHYVSASFLSHISSIFFFSSFHIHVMRAYCLRFYFFNHNPADENFNFHHSTSFPSHHFHPGTVDFEQACSNTVYILTHAKKDSEL